MHYGPDGRLGDDTFDISRPLYGLSEHYFSGMTFDELEALVRDRSRQVATLMNEWSRLA